MRQGLHRVEQVFGRQHLQHAGAPDRGVVYVVGARCRHEFERMLQVFHVHQEGAVIRIARQVIDDIAEIDTGA